MDSYGDKFLSAPDDQRREGNGHGRRGYASDSLAIENQPSNYNSMGSYDPYNSGSNKPLSEKIGIILEDVDKIKEGDNTEQIRQKVAQNSTKKLAKQAKDHRGRLPGLQRQQGAAARAAAFRPLQAQRAPRREFPRLS